MKKKVLVTGNAGFIGFHLCNKLLDQGHIIVGIDNLNSYYDQKLKLSRNRQLLNHQNFSFIQADINSLDYKNLNHFDIAVNLAAQPGVRLRKDKHYLYEHSNIKGFESFCNFCLKNNIDQVIYASSSSVYSDQGEGKFDENSTTLNPKSIYGKSKLENEFFAEQFSKKHNISFVGLRFFSVYGPWGRPDMAYYSFTEAIKKNAQISLHNNGEMARDMTYIDDVIEGIVGAINFQFNNKKTPLNEVFNLGNDHPIKTKQMLETIESKLGSHAKIKNIRTTNESLRTHANISKSRKLLGYSPKISFNEGIVRFLDWHADYIRR